MKLELFWPLSRPCIITQPFGTNGAYYRAHDINIDGHNGLDLLTFHGQPVYAPHDGFAKYFVDSKNGHGVELRSDKMATMLGKTSHFKTIFVHFCDREKEPKFASPIPHDGKDHFVKAGDLIGYADDTGLSSGDHLHFGLKPIAMDKNRKWFNTRQNNGYLGCIDPSFYMANMSAEEYRRALDGIAHGKEIMTAIVALPSEQQKPLLTALEALLRSLTALFRPRGR